MRCEIWDTVTDRMIRVDEDATPICGEDFCDDCGDCLGCADPSDLCRYDKNGLHHWVRYVSQGVDGVG